MPEAREVSIVKKKKISEKTVPQAVKNAAKERVFVAAKRTVLADWAATYPLKKA